MKARDKFRPRGSGGLFRRGRIWWLRYYKDGRAFSESTRDHRISVAKGRLAQRMQEIRVGTFAPEKHSVDQLMAACLLDYALAGKRSLPHARARWEAHLKPYFGRRMADAVTSDHLQQYQQKRLAEGAANGTINRELMLLRRAFALGMRATPPKLARMPHFPRLREAAPRAGFVDDAQAAKLAAACAQVGLWMRALFQLLYDTGMRRGEALGLRVRQVDLFAGMISLDASATKSGHGRHAPITHELRPLLVACCSGKEPDAPVFTYADGAAVRDIRVAWRRVTKEAGCPDLLVHDLRRSAVRRMVRRGISERVAMEISGHRTRAVFDRYNIVSPADLRDAAEKLSGPGTATPTPQLQAVDDPSSATPELHRLDNSLQTQ